MRFIGVDLAWTRRGRTGLCVVEEGAVAASGCVGSDEDLIEWLRPQVEGDVLVAIDAPLIVLNATGRRPAEQAISRCFGAYHASAHSANLGLPSFKGGVRGEWLAGALSLEIDPMFPPRVAVRRAIEVYPHTAIVALFNLASTLKYKAKAGRTVASRSVALAELLRHLASLQHADPPLDVETGPRWTLLTETVRTATTASALAQVEDEIDAFVCAYTALYYWTHGTTRCRIAGGLKHGYIVTPVTPELGACLDRVAAEPNPQRSLDPARESSPDRDSTQVALNVDRVAALLPEARTTFMTHTAELVVDGIDGVVAVVTADGIELRLPTIEWTHGTHGPAEASRFFARLITDGLSDDLLAAELERARAARRSEFVACRECGIRTPPENRVGPLCHSCASAHGGVVF
jgi:predicted RNase H-like nuclease